jgi:hypothetical protein
MSPGVTSRSPISQPWGLVELLDSPCAVMDVYPEEELL